MEMERSSSIWICPSVPEQISQRNSPCFRPIIVSFGPIFHDCPQVRSVEALKPEISRILIQECIDASGYEVEIYRRKLYDACIEMRSCYSEEIRKRFNNQQFYDMMLSDVCFIVAVIVAVVGENGRNLPLPVPLMRMCIRDFFILENQIPFLLVRDLAALRFGKRAAMNIHRFLSAVVHRPHDPTSNRLDRQPLHLLDLLRLKCMGIGESPGQSSDTHCTPFFSAKRLHDRGVRFFSAVGQKIGYSIGQMEFDATTGSLYMPPLIIDESFESIFLNLAAYEASRCGLVPLSEMIVTTFLCLLRHLARDAESVGLLRMNNVILCKEDNQSIVELFQRMSENLEPNFLLYHRLSMQLQIFPSGIIAAAVCWFRKPYTARLIRRFFFTTAVLVPVVAFTELLLSS